MKKYIQTVFCTPETIQYSRDVKLHFSMWLCKKKNLSTTVRKKKNTDTRATAVTKLLALKNDYYLNNPKRKKTQDKDSQKEQTNKNLKIVRAHISKNKKDFFPLSISPNSLLPTLPKLKINYSRCFFV